MIREAVTDMLDDYGEGEILFLSVWARESLQCSAEEWARVVGLAEQDPTIMDPVQDRLQQILEDVRNNVVPFPGRSQ